MVECPPLNWKVWCSTRGHWVNRRSVSWARAFTSTASARSKFQALTCRQLPSPKSKKLSQISSLSGPFKHNNICCIALTLLRRLLFCIENKSGQAGNWLLGVVVRRDTQPAAFSRNFQAARCLCEVCFSRWLLLPSVARTESRTSAPSNGCATAATGVSSWRRMGLLMWVMPRVGRRTGLRAEKRISAAVTGITKKKK